MAAAGNPAGELREDVPLKTGSKNRSLCSCSEDFLGGSKFVNISFVILTLVITLALIIQIYYGDFQVVPHGSVATDSRECSEIGTTILKQGGNSVDAAVAAAFCLAVVSPHITGLDAGGQMLIYDHRSKFNADVIDFDYQRYNSETFPKLLVGLLHVHKTYGRLPWKDLVQPSADLAREGFLVSKQLELAVRKARAEKLFGHSLQAGEIFTMNLLADTLRSIADISEQDLINTIPEETAPNRSKALNVVFKNYNVLVPNGPKAGPELLANLQHLEELNITKYDVNVPKLVYKLANEAQIVNRQLNVTSNFHRCTSSNIAIMDLNDLYVSLVVGMYLPFGTMKMSSGGYLLDVLENRLECGRIPMILTDMMFVCGKRMVVGAEDVVMASQIVVTLLTSGENITSSVENPRFDILGNDTIGLEDHHVSVFSDNVVQELEKLGKLQNMEEPYSSCNVVEKIMDDLNSHSDSRGGGISSRF